MQPVTQLGGWWWCRSAAIGDGLDAGKAQREAPRRWPITSPNLRVQPIQGRLEAGAPRHGRTTCSLSHPVSATSWPATSTSFFILDLARRRCVYNPFCIRPRGRALLQSLPRHHVDHRKYSRCPPAPTCDLQDVDVDVTPAGR
jgi:hypothetical protein